MKWIFFIASSMLAVACHHGSNHHTKTIVVNDDHQYLKIEMQGEISFSNTLQDIESMMPDATATYRHNKKYVRFQPGDDGVVQCTISFQGNPVLPGTTQFESMRREAATAIAERYDGP